MADERGAYPFNDSSAWQVHPWGSDWYELQPYERQNGQGVGDNLQRRRYGGDLQGILQHLDYLQQLGVDALYLTPLFWSPSSHKYDALCYHHVDPTFGPDPAGDKKLLATENPLKPETRVWTKADRLALQLLDEVPRRKMHLIFDGVFNHLGDRRFAFQDGERNQQASPGTPVRLFGGDAGAVAAFVVASLLQGVPMVYDGQEAGMTTAIPFPHTSLQVAWDTRPDVTRAYKQVLRARAVLYTLRSGTPTVYSTAEVCAFTKVAGGETALVLASVRSTAQSYAVPATLAGTTWTNFLDSRSLSPSPKASHSEAVQDFLANPQKLVIWRFRVQDVQHVLDQLALVEAAVPGLAGRLDHGRIAVAGHSFGAQTAALLLGSRVRNADGSSGEDLADPRIKAGVLFSAAGRGDADLSPFAAEHFPYLNQSYADLKTPTLVVAGDQDYSPLTQRGPDWFTDAYTLSPGANCLVTLFGAEHMLGGISGYFVTETTDENPARVAVVQQLSWAYLRSALFPGDTAWTTACATLRDSPQPLGRVTCK